MMLKKSLFLMGFTVLINFSMLSFANEPINLEKSKQAVIKYHDSQEYERDIHSAIQKAMNYLKERVAKNDFGQKKPTLVLDIDETSLSNYDDMVKLHFGGTYAEITQAEDKGTDPAIDPTLLLYRYAKLHGIAVFFITGRTEEERTATTDNLKKAGYHHWNGLILRQDPYLKSPAAIYKTAMRKQLTDQQGYHIILNIGDQESDLAGGYADKTIKLPNPYYFIP